MKATIHDIIHDITQLSAIQFYDLCSMLEIDAGAVLENLAMNLKGSMKFRVANVDANNHQKIAFIKAIREQTQLGLKEAKEVSEGILSLKVRNYSYDQIRKIREYADTFGYEPYNVG